MNLRQTNLFFGVWPPVLWNRGTHWCECRKCVLIVELGSVFAILSMRTSCQNSTMAHYPMILLLFTSIRQCWTQLLEDSWKCQNYLLILRMTTHEFFVSLKIILLRDTLSVTCHATLSMHWHCRSMHANTTMCQVKPWVACKRQSSLQSLSFT